jgi:ribosome-associated protein
MALHEAETWRDDLISKDDALERWIAQHPGTDTQQLRALIRQARKDTPADADAVSKGLAPRHGRAYREIFQLVKQELQGGNDDE